MTLRSRVPSGYVGVAVVALLATVIVGIFIGATAGSLAAGPTLVVTDGDGEEIITTPVDEDTEIVIEYTHSVEKTLVRDVYVPGDGTLVMTRMEFSSFGAGLPSQAEVIVREGRYVYHPPRTEYETLRVMTGTIADHDLIVGDERYDIASLTDGGPVELTIEQRTRTLL
ncbi:DUF1850 domain-containing protein [Halorubrum sp. DTA98]|uniref:DUF1850 domain-containing protein n=1 Tax=Halorubrum sp. DTA98 TaxID=3402163 RepID=UPI003AADBF33